MTSAYQSPFKKRNDSATSKETPKFQ